MSSVLPSLSSAWPPPTSGADSPASDSSVVALSVLPIELSPERWSSSANNNNNDDGGGTEQDANLQVIMHNVTKFVSTLGGGINQRLGEHGAKILEEVREKHEALVIQPIESEISRLDNSHTAAVEIRQSLQRAVEKADDNPVLNIDVQPHNHTQN